MVACANNPGAADWGERGGGLDGGGGGGNHRRIAQEDGVLVRATDRAHRPGRPGPGRRAGPGRAANNRRIEQDKVLKFQANERTHLKCEVEGS